MKRTNKPASVITTSSAIVKYSLLIGCLFIALIGRAQQNTLTAIGNVSGVPAEMKKSELKSVLMGERQRWKNGNRVIIALMKTNTALGKTISSRVYDMSGEELNKYWLSLVFQGKAQAPIFFTSVTELQNFVAQNPGAIGIIDKPIVLDDLRSLVIDGKSSF